MVISGIRSAVNEKKYIRRYLADVHAITFEHMIVDEKSFSRNKYSLNHFFSCYGLFVGLRIWIGFWLNNVNSVRNLAMKTVENR